MDMTGLELGAWISIYFGVGLIGTCLRSPEMDSPESDSLKGLRFPGYGLLVVGILILGIEVLHHFPKIDL